MTICFRVRMDYFTVIGDYIPLLELLDGGGWLNGVEVEKFQERTIDFRIRFLSLFSSRHNPDRDISGIR